MKEFGLTPTIRVPEPNTWRELIKTLDANGGVTNQVIGLQEYGKSNTSLIAGLEARGARVDSIRVYHWDFPEDTKPLAENIRAIAKGQRDVLLLTSAHQVANMLRMASDLGLEEALRDNLNRMIVASIGPTTSEMLKQNDLPVDLEPEHPKMGHLVQETAERAQSLLGGRAARQVALRQQGVTPLNKNAPWYDGPFMRACRREASSVTPVWLMRQAGGT